MTSPYGWLLGLGKGAAGLGDDMNTRGLLEQQKREQQARDALSRLVTLQQIGGTEIQPGTDPRATLAAATQANTMRSGGAIPNAAIGMPDDATPDAYGSPRTVTLPGVDGKPMQILMDPSKTPQASAERRQSLAQAAIDRRAQAAQDAITARADQANQAKTLAGVKAARADYNTLKSLDPKHPLVQDPFDADNAANYGDALKFKQSQILQQDAYHPPVSEGDWAPSGAIDKDTGEPILYNKKTGARMLMTNATSKPGAGVGGQNAPQMAAAKANMDAAMKIMDDYEAKLKAGNANYGVLDATQGALASSPAALNAKGPLGAAESLLANASSSHLQSSNPELMRYLTAKKYIAEAILNTHKRPNQTQYEIEQEISGAGPNPEAMQIDMAASRRKRMYDEVFNNPAAGGVGTRPATAPAGGKTPTYEEWKKANGIP